MKDQNDQIHYCSGITVLNSVWSLWDNPSHQLGPTQPLILSKDREENWDSRSEKNCALR